MNAAVVSTNNESKIENEISMERQEVHFPKLEFPKFGGNLLKWSEFWGAFYHNTVANRFFVLLNFPLCCHLEGYKKDKTINKNHHI